MNILITEKEFQEYRKLQQENETLKQKLLKIIENIDVSYNEWEKWKEEISKLKESDKYKNKEDKYKNAWEELKEIVVYDDGESSETFGQMFSDDLKELEQKHNLGGVE